ncbi:MAG: hypothetical protein AAB364_02500 [Patescibacteria group bacterium]
MKGIFTISIDHELAWGYVDRKIDSKQRSLIKQEYLIVERLVKLFEQYQVSATWAIVGRLLEPVAEEGHLDLWFDSRRTIELINNSKVSQEIGSHSYGHIIYNEVDQRIVELDLQNAKRVHDKHGLPFHSFVFPRNQVRWLGSLRSSGLVCYRGNSRKWFDAVPLRLVKRFCRWLDYFLPSVYTVRPHIADNGLVNIPDSLLLLGRDGLRRLVSPGLMIAKMNAGLDRAVARREVFHLWFHPSNFSYDVENQFKILEALLERARNLRDQGKIEILTMKEIADKVLVNVH